MPRGEGGWTLANDASKTLEGHKFQTRNLFWTSL
jgi:hypothetical protein